VAQEPEKITPNKPKYVRGIHLTAWVAGSKKLREPIDKMFEETELNTVVIAIKEYEGDVYIHGFKDANKYGTFVNAIPDIEDYLKYLKSKNIYPIARIVVFKDNNAARKFPNMAVKTPAGGLWHDKAGNTWLDPFNKDAWAYNIDIAERAIDLGFEEIQFDYLRFPSDGNTKNCRYSMAHTTTTASAALVGFLQEAHRRLKTLRGANISIDVFGLTTTVTHDMGIGQRILEMTQWVDFVSPMVYPSHYNKGSYGITEPNRSPYKTVFMGMQGACKRFGSPEKIRPYLQDFSLGYKYGSKEVRAQIQAAYDNDVPEWLLWNARCVYTKSALKEKKFMDTYEKTLPTAEPPNPIPAPMAVQPTEMAIEPSTSTASPLPTPQQEPAISTNTITQ